MLSNIVKSDRYYLIILAVAWIAGGLWYIRPQLGVLPLLIALIPWVLKTALDTLPYQPSIVDIPIALFLATAATGMWLSYDQNAAQTKYWLIIGAVILFYSMAIQPRNNLWNLAGFMTLLGSLVGLYFLMTHNWQVQPAKLPLFNNIGLRWMAIRPTLGIDNIHPNVAAGLAAIAFPFPIAIFFRRLINPYQPLNNLILLLYSVISAAFLLFILLITTSRGAILALGAALGIWVLWEASYYIGKNRRQNQSLIFGVIFSLVALFGLFILLTFRGGPVALINQLPGPNNVGSRVELFKDVWFLIGDFSWTGSGLASFPGLYSTYSLGLPSFVLGHSHNLFLDITLEQGPLGLLALTGILGVSLMILLRSIVSRKRNRHLSLLNKAVVISLLVLMIHGLIDDPLYGSRAVLFLFLLPGMAAALYKAKDSESSKKKKKKQSLEISRRSLAIGFGSIVVFFLIIGLSLRTSLISDWYANLGALKMAKTQMIQWPTDKWDDGRNVSNLAPALDLFQKSLAIDPRNPTARYRLGLIAMLNRNYEMAAQHLEVAYQQQPGNQGVQKSLGYTYVWIGDFDQAFTILRGVQESGQEMNIYISWWNQQGRPDLSNNAAIMAQRLVSAESPPVN